MYRTAVGSFWLKAQVIVFGMLLSSSIVSAEPVGIDLATHWSTGVWFDMLLGYIDEYNQQNPDVVVRHVFIKDFQRSRAEQFLVQAAAGVAPDIIHTASSGVAGYAAMNLLSPPPPAVLTEMQARFLPATEPLSTKNGVFYGPPTENQPYGMMFNGRMYDEFGVAREIPQSWDQLAEHARAFRTFDTNGQLQTTGIEIVTSRTLRTLARANGATLVDESGKRLTINTDAWRETLNFLHSLVATQSAVTNVRPRPSHLYFREEGTAIRLGANPWMRRQILPNWFGDDYDRYLQVHSGSMPAGPSGSNPPIAGQYGYLLAVTSQAEHPEKAWDFVKWLTVDITDEGYTRMGHMMHYYGSIPNTIADFRTHPYRDEPFIKGFMSIVTDGRTTTLDEPDVLREKFLGVMSNRMENAIVGEEPVESVLEELQRFGQSILNE